MCLAEQKEFASLKLESLFGGGTSEEPKIHETVNFEDFIRRFRPFYVDKTMWVKEVMLNPNKLIAVSRPLRMGKSLNISMLRKYIDVAETSSTVEVFEDLMLSNDLEFQREHMNKHPVLSIKMPKSLLRVKSFSKWKDNIMEYFGELSDRYCSDDPISDLDSLYPAQILDRIITKLFSDQKEKKVVILVDNFEYPLIAALKGGIIKEAYSFYAQIFPASLLENDKIEKIVTVGML